MISNFVETLNFLPMKRIFLLLLFVCITPCVYSQTYVGINIVEPEYNTYDSFSGIVVSSITPQSNGSYDVVLYNSNHDDDYNCYTYYRFEWYLSYKGKRVSDYFSSSIRCRKSSNKSVLPWPDEIPKGNEKYVTVQFGHEIHRDRRDDF